MNEDLIKKTEGHVKEINISTEMKTSFLNYAMSVIVSRALPDIRDGLKPLVNITHTVIQASMKQWFVWHNLLVTACL